MISSHVLVLTDAIYPPIKSDPTNQNRTTDITTGQQNYRTLGQQYDRTTGLQDYRTAGLQDNRKKGQKYCGAGVLYLIQT